MKNKLKKTFAAALAALTMTTAMAGTASAADNHTWNVRRIVQSGYVPSDSHVSMHVLNFRTLDEITKIESKCSSFSSSEYTNGDIAYVLVVSLRMSQDGDLLSTVNTYHTHRATGEYRNIPMASIVEYGEILRMEYRLQNPHSLACYITGSARATGGVFNNEEITH